MPAGCRLYPNENTTLRDRNTLVFLSKAAFAAMSRGLPGKLWYYVYNCHTAGILLQTIDVLSSLFPGRASWPSGHTQLSGSRGRFGRKPSEGLILAGGASKSANGENLKELLACKRKVAGRLVGEPLCE
jgi:hypothetical protein